MKKYIYALLTFSLVVFSLSGCSDSDTKADDSEVTNGVYVSESFGKDFGSFTLETIKGIPWMIDYSSAKATGYVSGSGKTTSSESYLVSQPINLLKSSGAYVSFSYILRYYTNYGTPYGGLADQVLITDNYTGNPSTTQWTDITGKLEEGVDWDEWYDYKSNIPTSFIGKRKVVIALHYACGERSATWEVRNLTVKEGQTAEKDEQLVTSSSTANANKNDASSLGYMGRMEYPRVKGGSSIVLMYETPDAYGLNYSVEWDCDKKSQRWTCYELYRGFGGNVGRYEGNPQYPNDPSLGAAYRWDKDYYYGSGYDHGHLCPSADRQYSAEANRQTFYLTNMQPQKHKFNAGVWEQMETRLRKWIALSPVSDTLFVCKGGTIDDEADIIERINDKLIVPKYFYMAVLYKSAKGYKALAFWAEHLDEDHSHDNLRSYVIPIDELEARTGIDFFCNLPDDAESQVEATVGTSIWSW